MGLKWDLSAVKENFGPASFPWGRQQQMPVPNPVATQHPSEHPSPWGSTRRHLPHNHGLSGNGGHCTLSCFTACPLMQQQQSKSSTSWLATETLNRRRIRQLITQFLGNTDNILNSPFKLWWSGGLTRSTSHTQRYMTPPFMAQIVLGCYCLGIS